MKIRTTVLTAALALASSASFAADVGSGNIIFQGNVDNDTCFVTSNGGDAHTIYVNLGTANLSAIGLSSITNPVRTSGVGNNVTNFTVQCSTTSQATFTFKAPTAQTALSGKALMLNGGQQSPQNAAGFGIVLYPANGPFDANSAHKLDGGNLFADETLAANVPYNVSFTTGYVKTTGALKGGIANGTLPFVITTP